MDKIINVDATHRIRISKQWNAYKGEFTYEVILEEFKRFFIFKKWGVTGWENSNDWFVRTRVYNSEYHAEKFANTCKNNFLSTKENN